MQIKKTKIALAIMTTIMSTQAVSQGFALEEIVVTAQKKSESLMDVPVSVTALTGEKLNDIGVFDLTELDKATSGLVVTTDGKVALRGVDSSLESFTASQRVTTYFNGSYQPNQREFWLSNFDMERFEILRGPQGTLYGAASPSGAIVAYPKKPSLFESDGFVTHTLGQNNLNNTQFAYGAPIIEDELSIRIAGSYDENNSSGGRYQDGADYLDRTKSGRATLLWAPSDTFEANLVYGYTELDNSSAPIFQSAEHGLDERINPGNVEDLNEQTIKTTVLGMNWDLGFAELVSQTYYSESLLDTAEDYDFSKQDDGVTKARADVRIYNQEFRLSSVGNDFWDWAMGAYYSRTDTSITADIDARTLIDAGLVGGTFGTLASIPTLVDSAINSKTKASALFTHNTFFLAEDWSLIAGLRWNKGVTVSNVDADGSSVLGPLDYHTDYDYATEIYWTGTVKLQHNLDSDSNVYLTFDRGSRQGSAATDFQGYIARLLDDKFLFENETSNSLELGYKASLLENRLNLTAALYHTTFKQFQINASGTVRDNLHASGERSLEFIDNVPEVIVKGIDLEATYLATESLLLSVSASYSDSVFEDYSEAPLLGPGLGLAAGADNGAFTTQDLSGTEVGGLAPSLSVTASANYSQDIAFLDSSWYMGGLMNYNGDRTNAFAGAKTGGYTTFDLSTGLRTDEWDLRLWVKNAFNKGAATSAEQSFDGTPLRATIDGEFAGGPSSGFVSLANTGFYRGSGYTNPRQAGVTASYNF